MVDIIVCSVDIQIGAMIKWIAIARAALEAPAAVDVPRGLSNDSLGVVIYQVINYFLAFAGIIAVIFLILAGIRFVGARGSEEEVRAARNSIIAIVAGLIVIGLAWVTVSYVIGSVNPPAKQAPVGKQ